MKRGPGINSSLYLVLEAMSTPLHVHLLGIGVVELALAQLAVEADQLALVVLQLLDVVLSYWLDVLLKVHRILLV